MFAYIGSFLYYKIYDHGYNELLAFLFIDFVFTIIFQPDVGKNSVILSKLFIPVVGITVLKIQTEN